MKLDITKGIQRKGNDIPFDLVEAWGEDRWNGDAVAFVRPVAFSGSYMMAEDTALVRGTARALIEAPCARCLAPARVEVAAQVEEAFLRDTGEPVKPGDDAYRYEGHALDVTDAVRTALLQELPTRILCKADCRGLCPVCGQDLNVSACSCRREPEDRNPFKALATLLNEDEEV